MGGGIQWKSLLFRSEKTVGERESDLNLSRSCHRLQGGFCAVCRCRKDISVGLLYIWGIQLCMIKHALNSTLEEYFLSTGMKLKVQCKSNASHSL